MSGIPEKLCRHAGRARVHTKSLFLVPWLRFARAPDTHTHTTPDAPYERNMRNEVILVANAAVACGVLGLAWCGRIAEGAQTLLAWSVVDTGLLFVRTDMRADFRDSILLHHLTVVTLVAQFLAHGTPGDEDIVLACLLLEITTPALCVCNLLGARRARAVAWIAGRSWVAWRMLALLPRHDERANLASAAPWAAKIFSSSPASSGVT